MRDLNMTIKGLTMYIAHININLPSYVSDQKQIRTYVVGVSSSRQPCDQVVFGSFPSFLPLSFSPPQKRGQEARREQKLGWLLVGLSSSAFPPLSEAVHIPEISPSVRPFVSAS